MSAGAPVVLNLISSLGIGGAERLLIDTMRVSAGDAGVSYVVAIMNAAVNPGFYAELEASGAPVYRLDRREGHLHPKYLKALLAIVDRHKVDVIHTHNEGSRTWGMAISLLRPRVKLVYTVHSHDNAQGITGMKRFAYTRLVDATVAISDFVAGTAGVLKPKRLVTIPNGISLSRFDGVGRRQGGDGVFRLVNVARFIRFKGQDVLIAALALARARGLDVRCTFVGTVAEQDFFDELVAQVAAAGLGEAVTFVRDRADIETFFAEADAFVLSSRDEGFGIVLIEAMAAGSVPVAAANSGYSTVLTGPGADLLVPPGNAAALADRIVTLAGDPERLGALRTWGKDHALTFSVETAGPTFVEVYDRALRRR